MALSYITAPLTMTNMNTMKIMTKNMIKMKLGKFLENQFAEKLWNYFKYLESKKIAVENLAIKFGVTERTIQNDVKFLIDGGYIEIQTNKTTKGKQTKNSYITIKQYESNVLVKNIECFLIHKHRLN